MRTAFVAPLGADMSFVAKIAASRFSVVEAAEGVPFLMFKTSNKSWQSVALGSYYQSFYTSYKV